MHGIDLDESLIAQADRTLAFQFSLGTITWQRLTNANYFMRNPYDNPNSYDNHSSNVTTLTLTLNA